MNPAQLVPVLGALAVSLVACTAPTKPAAPAAKPAEPAAAPTRQVEPLPAASTPPAVPLAQVPTARTSIAFGDSGSTRALEPFFPRTSYDARVPAPDRLLRQPLGTFTAHHQEILAALRTIAASASERARLVPFGATHEGRELVNLIVTAPENMSRIEEIRARIAKLADPRGVALDELEDIARTTPAVAWLGYSIHGDEMSGADAALAVAYHLTAGTSADVLAILRNVVVVIDPAENPDGRERILSQLEHNAGYVPTLDGDSMSRGRWPYGRGNHYLFDMNRDWIWGTQPETRARWKAIRAWHPQLLVDAHEMGAYDSFLFYPATDPFTPHFPSFTKKWWQAYARDQARAFDAHGWSYYTREWADSWYPGYTDAWGTFQGACGILYEQARYLGQSLKKPTGEIVTYRDAVARQAVGSVANLTTLAENRESVLRDYVAEKQRSLTAETPGNGRMFVLVLGRDPAREAQLVRNLSEQGIEIMRTSESFEARDVETTLRAKHESLSMPAGALVISPRQPLSALIKASLEFDPRYDKASLERERKELERKQRSKAYDVTAWSPAHAYDLEAYWCNAQDVRGELVTELPPGPVGVTPLSLPNEPVYAWIVDGASDAAVRFAARALELGLSINLGDEPFKASGRTFARGSLIVRRHENAADVAAKVADAANAARVSAVASGTARSGDEGPDLGGQHFELLARPHVALLSNAPIDTSDFGHVWHLIDAQLALPCTLLDAQEFGSVDLRRYNVLIVPEGGGAVVHDHADALRTWVRGGGTLIAWGGSAAAVCDERTKLTSVRTRTDALDELEQYALDVKREREAGRLPIDVARVYDDAPPASAQDQEREHEEPKDGDGERAKKRDEKDGKDGKDGKDAKQDDEQEDAARRDEWLQTFSPSGVLLRGEVNTDTWISAGCRDELPVFFQGSDVLMSLLPVRCAVRLASSERLRLSGLLWPEAKERIADSAYCTVERQGAGQVILFASSPVFRGWVLGTARLLSNAIVYGPGAGARQPIGW